MLKEFNGQTMEVVGVGTPIQENKVWYLEESRELKFIEHFDLVQDYKYLKVLAAFDSRAQVQRLFENFQQTFSNEFDKTKSISIVLSRT